MERRRALVTGASSPTGIEIVRRLAKAAYSIIVVTRREGALREQLRQSGISGDDVSIVEVDLLDIENATQTLRSAVKRVGSLDTLVNAAGHFSSAPVIEVSPIDIIGSYMNNVVAPYVAIHSTIPSMIAQKHGVIINIASLFGLVVPRDARCLSYGSAKASLVHLTKLLAFELGRYFIRVNCICPGPLNEVTADFSVGRYERLESARVFLRSQSIPRFATPAEVADMVEYLIGDSAKSITGAIFRIDSGYT